MKAHENVFYIITDCLQNSVRAFCAFTVHITNSIYCPNCVVFGYEWDFFYYFMVLICLFLNKYCNVLHMYCHVQFYITSLE